MTYTYTLKLQLQREKIFEFFSDLERWFRLNPQWEVEAFGSYEFGAGCTFAVTVRYDRSEQEVAYLGKITEIVGGERLALVLQAATPRTIGISLLHDDGAYKLIYEEESEDELHDADKQEINLWMRSVANYLLVTSRKTLRNRIWKWFVDRVWLQMSPFGRRIALIILMGEAFSLAMFLLFLLWHYFLR